MAHAPSQWAIKNGGVARRAEEEEEGSTEYPNGEAIIRDDISHHLLTASSSAMSSKAASVYLYGALYRRRTTAYSVLCRIQHSIRHTYIHTYILCTYLHTSSRGKHILSKLLEVYTPLVTGEILNGMTSQISHVHTSEYTVRLHTVHGGGVPGVNYSLDSKDTVLDYLSGMQHCSSASLQSGWGGWQWHMGPGIRGGRSMKWPCFGYPMMH